MDARAQRRYEPAIEPGVLLKPRLIPWRWVGQRQVLRRVLLPGTDRRGERLFATAAQKMALGMLPDQESLFNPGQPGQQLIQP